MANAGFKIPLPDRKEQPAVIRLSRHNKSTCQTGNQDGILSSEIAAVPASWNS